MQPYKKEEDTKREGERVEKKKGWG